MLKENSRGWMFCPISGALLVVDSQTGIASCSDSNHRVDLTSKTVGTPHAYRQERCYTTHEGSTQRRTCTHIENTSCPKSFFRSADLPSAKNMSSSDIKVQLVYLYTNALPRKPLWRMRPQKFYAWRPAGIQAKVWLGYLGERGRRRQCHIGYRQGNGGETSLSLLPACMGGEIYPLVAP